MSNKSFSIYSANELAVEAGDQLVIEVAKSQMAFLVIQQNKKSVTAFELFSFGEDESENFSDLLENIAANSKILNENIANVSVYFNNEFCLPVPIYKFNKEISEEYLNVVFGESFSSKIHFEHLAVEPGIMNTYRVSEDLIAALSHRFQKFTAHHIYSNIIRRLANSTVALPDELVTLQFYNTFMIVVLTRNGGLQLIQTYQYNTPEDVLYYLLNIARQFELHSETLKVQISGMIDVDFKLYRELITYFKEVIVENVSDSNLLLNTGGHPLHYFTPFFNLAL